MTNAVVHARSATEVVLDHSDGALRVAVTDESSYLPILVESMDLLVDHSRGLSMVSDMSDDWGVVIDGHCKTVWFSLQRPHRALRRFGWRMAWRYDPTMLSSQYPMSFSMQNARIML